MHDTAMLLGALGGAAYDQGVEVITPYFGSSGTGQINAIFPVDAARPHEDAMPHLTVDYSGDLEEVGDFDTLCATLCRTLVEFRADGQPVYPLGGVRVRAIAADHWCIGDGRADAAFVHARLTVAAGRGARHAQGHRRCAVRGDEGALRGPVRAAGPGAVARGRRVRRRRAPGSTTTCTRACAGHDGRNGDAPTPPRRARWPGRCTTRGARARSCATSRARIRG